MTRKNKIVFAFSFVTLQVLCTWVILELGTMI